MEKEGISSNSTSSSEPGVSVSYALYNLLNGKKLDLKVCVEINIKMPLKSNKVDIYKEPYKYLIFNLSVDPFNEDDRFYKDRCFVYRTNGTDIPLNVRRMKIYPNITLNCGGDCKYEGLDEEGNMNCDCANPSICSSGDLLQDFTESVIYTFNTSNFVIITCPVRF